MIVMLELSGASPEQVNDVRDRVDLLLDGSAQVVALNSDRGFTLEELGLLIDAFGAAAGVLALIFQLKDRRGAGAPQSHQEPQVEGINSPLLSATEVAAMRAVIDAGGGTLELSDLKLGVNVDGDVIEIRGERRSI